MRSLVTAILVGLVPVSAHAAKFANQFTEFELPVQWSCTLEGSEWVCNSSNKAKERDALIILAAKLRGEQDTIEKYLTYLKATKSYTSAPGKAIVSQVKSAAKIEIDKTEWVDATHFESEIPNYVTRYLATVKEDIAVLITYSIAKDKVDLYQKDFEALVKSLHVFRKKAMADTTAAAAKGQAINTANIPTTVAEGTVFGGGEKVADAKERAAHGNGGGGNGFLLYVILGGAAAIGGFAIYKKKKAGG